MSIRSDFRGFTAGAQGAAEQAKPWVIALGRAGYVARAVLYFTIGVLAALVAFGEGGRLTDGKGALDELSRQPLGMVLLVLMSIGLAGYGVWRAVQGVLDPGHEASGRFGPIKRAAWLLGALLHFGLAAYAVSRLSGAAGGGPEDAKSTAASALRIGEWGPLLLGGIGVTLIGLAVYELICAWRAKLDEQLDLSPLSSTLRRRLVQLSRFGIAARGVVFAMAGAFMLSAAINSDPSRAKGMGETLQVLREAPFGQALLAAVALGLVAFGAYQIVEARYRRLFGSSSAGAVRCWS